MKIENTNDLLFFAIAVLLVALSSYLLNLQSNTNPTLIRSTSKKQETDPSNQQ